MTSERTEIFRLFQGMHQGDLSAEDFQRLQALLRDNASVRSLWYQYSDVEAGLGSVVSAAVQAVQVSPRPQRRITWWATAAAALILTVVGIGFAMWETREAWAPRATQNAAQPVFATLTAADNARWADPNTELVLRASEMPSGRVILESGRAEFLFSGGARVSIEGPADFEPLNPRLLSLRRGKVLCRCLDEPSRMTVVTPHTTVTDLGTEFAVVVDDAATTHVAVLSGSVSVGSETSARQLSQGQTAIIGNDRIVRLEERPLGDFAGRMRLDPFGTVAVDQQVNRLTVPTFAGEFPGEWRITNGHCTAVAGRGIGGATAVRIRSLGNRYWPLISQRVALHDAVGQVAIVAIAALNPSDDPLSGKQCAIIKVVCRDAQDREFAHSECHFQTANHTRDHYVRAQTHIVVPPGTVTIELQALLNATGLATGSLYFDQPALHLVPVTSGHDDADNAVRMKIHD
jgi:ferric-dicitrate binding protein FerR (iron transport regulator)